MELLHRIVPRDKLTLLDVPIDVYLVNPRRVAFVDAILPREPFDETLYLQNVRDTGLTVRTLIERLCDEGCKFSAYLLCKWISHGCAWSDLFLSVQLQELCMLIGISKQRVKEPFELSSEQTNHCKPPPLEDTLQTLLDMGQWHRAIALCNSAVPDVCEGSLPCDSLDESPGMVPVLIEDEISSALEAVLKLIPNEKKHHLDKMLDWDNRGVSIDVGALSRNMLWLKDHYMALRLSEVEYYNISESTRSQYLVRKGILQKWKSKYGFAATFKRLILTALKLGECHSAIQIAEYIAKEKPL